MRSPEKRYKPYIPNRLRTDLKSHGVVFTTRLSDEEFRAALTEIFALMWEGVAPNKRPRDDVSG